MLHAFRTALAVMLICVYAAHLPVLVAGARRGVPWAVNSRWAPKLLTGKVDWYHHWQDGSLGDELEGDAEFVPMFWGESKMDEWERQKDEMEDNLPDALLFLNEPDVRSQAWTSPQDAADLYLREICPYQEQGVRISTPQITYDFSWLDRFLSLVREQGCEPDFVAVHWYGGKRELGKLKQFIRTGWTRYHKPMWLSEFGITAASDPTPGEVENFLSEALRWIDEQPFVERVAWHGVYSLEFPPDGFVTRFAAFFRRDSTLRRLANIYLYA
ncbi:hypothetical protein OC845_000374 [Tilletia horrida]|nr:hypothetical protein OC845_000374 [Tilletia horrida]